MAAVVVVDEASIETSSSVVVVGFTTTLDVFEIESEIGNWVETCGELSDDTGCVDEPTDPDET